jgi:hypothetical protein
VPTTFCNIPPSLPLFRRHPSLQKPCLPLPLRSTPSCYVISHGKKHGLHLQFRSMPSWWHYCRIAPRTPPVPSRPSQPAERKVSRNVYSNVATQLQCSLCSESHRLFKCDKFLRMQPRRRLTYAKQLNLCFNCLQTYSKNHQCSRQLCRQCNKRHHTHHHHYHRS